MFITITGIDQFMGFESIKVGQEFLLKKEIDNPYDDESILVENEKGVHYGRVANSVDSVARGTHSAGYVYESIKENTKCKIRFITENNAIAELV